MPGPAVTTASGVLRGTVEGGVATYRGIRYGRAERFAPPTPAESWTGELATAFGAIAPQPASMLTGNHLPAPSEDCLFLNVWAPADAAGAPVMVWFHGGGFTTGTGAIPWYHGTQLAHRGAVVVTVNYRLGPLGFLHLAAVGGERYEGAANAGILDQALALRWVAENIGAFGGDPARVTIFGESAGAMSVGTHLGLPSSRGLFAQAIAESGAATTVHTAEQGERIARDVLAALDVPTTDLGRLADLPIEAFSDVQADIASNRGIFVGLPFAPTVDGTTLPQRPMDALAPGVPLLVGTTEEEMKLFTMMAAAGGRATELDEDRLVRRVTQAVGDVGSATTATDAIATYRRRLGDDASPAEVFEAMSTDAIFRRPAIALAEAQSTQAPTFMYLFTHKTSSFGGALGSAHATEIPFVFDNLDQPGTSFLIGDATPERRQLATAMADAWVAFAATGDPSTEGLGPWPTYDTDRRATMRLDIVSTVVEDPHGDERRVWNP